MTCPHCQSTEVRRRRRRTTLGYRRFSCGGRRLRLSERTGTPSNELEYPTGIALLGFGNVDLAARFCTAFDEVHKYFGIDRTSISPPAQWEVFIAACGRWSAD